MSEQPERHISLHCANLSRRNNDENTGEQLLATSVMLAEMDEKGKGRVDELNRVLNEYKKRKAAQWGQHTPLQ